MDDDSDDGNLPGQSFFRNNNNDKEEQKHNEINENDNYAENDENQYPQNNDNYEYENDNNNDIINNYDYNDDYQENFDNGNYIESENSSYYNSNYYENDKDANYKNYNYNYFNNKNKNKNYKYNNYYYKKYNITKRKENYEVAFSTNFKLWLMLIIKLDSEKKKERAFSKNKKINQEIIDSFLKNYDIELNHKKEIEDKKNNLYIHIKNIKINHSVDKNYIVEFSIIIEDKIELFFVNKYIEIFVSGDIYFAKFPVFHFQVIDYKLTLDCQKNKKDKNNDNNIYDFSEEDEKLTIGMRPEYSINENKEFKELYIKIFGEGKIKDPQREIMDSLDNLIF